MKKIYHTLKNLCYRVKVGKGFFADNDQRKWEKHIEFVIKKKGKIVIGKKANFRTGVHLRAQNGGCLTIGNNFFANNNVSITALESVTIGDNVRMANNVVIVDHDHDYKNDNSKFLTAAVSIGDNVWIGANAVILRGVTIGDNAVVAAGSVVNKDVPEGTLVGGVPAKVLR